MPLHSEAIPKGVEWWCDPAGAQERLQLVEAGHSVRPCVHIPQRGSSGERKNPKRSGIDMVSERMRTGRLKIVREACMPLVRELGMYHYDETKQLEEPVDEDNHACDALRYLVVGLDRGRSVPSILETISDEERQAKEQAEAEAEQKRRRLEDLMAQSRINDDRWWTT